jgi:hypothetical protein
MNRQVKDALLLLASFDRGPDQFGRAGPHAVLTVVGGAEGVVFMRAEVDGY